MATNKQKSMRAVAAIVVAAAALLGCARPADGAVTLAEALLADILPASSAACVAGGAGAATSFSFDFVSSAGAGVGGGRRAAW
jgi:hypothetical protein